MPPTSVPPLPNADDPAALALSDFEAGTPRQWYWLEIAATRGGTASRLTGVLRHVGPLWCWPWLEDLAGARLYAATLAPAWQRARDQAAGAALYAAVLPALLAGLGLLPATQAFAGWLLVLFGPLWLAWRTKPAPPAAPGAPLAAALPGPEECTGLTGLLLASDCPPEQALTLVAALRANPDAAWPALVQRLPQLMPPAPTRRQCGLLRGAAWLAGAVPATLLLSLLPSPWGLIAAGLAGAGLNTVLLGRRAGLVTLGSAALVYGLGAAVHLL
ncbi:hypothetical protein [Jeongeupia sp. USM3]|uniref:hypothetical protein n=1 Tax=Jeongeupia sp. USM3 TaxID=1906741 RepID=UPI00089DE2CD|nr:hypothetical protein [Jeongeupia sp. USM3]AOY00425.1 hypothetical protein BJP62_08225 [Jeongeupia sp. USM3]